MKITDIKTFILDAYRTNWTFIKVETDEGLYGYGEASLGTQEMALSGCVNDIKRLVVGRNPLEIEKMRFEDTLEIEYDIKCVDFALPVLTVQPIVENAVKHGTSKKRGGGRVTVATFEDKENYIVKVSDTGCGFDPEKPRDDGKRHVGIANVRKRLSNMCNGSLTIESEIGVGTVATIKIPKGGKK